jgi:hypothetical protein
VLFYGLAIKLVDMSGMSPMMAKHAIPIEGYYYVTELCDNSLNNVESSGRC